MGPFAKEVRLLSAPHNPYLKCDIVTASMFHEDTAVDKCSFECLKIVLFKQSLSFLLDLVK